MRFFLLFCFSLWSGCLLAQTLIRFTEPDKSPITGASVYLSARTDSGRIWRSATDAAGRAVFQVMPGQYVLKISALGYKNLNKGLKITEKSAIFDFVAETDTKNLESVTVTARKPLLRQEEDKTIVDPEPIANTSTNAYEILEKTPGLFLDQDENVYLSSVTPATIYINGREQRMSAADIAGILKSLPPGSIERLEILRSPSVPIPFVTGMASTLLTCKLPKA